MARVTRESIEEVRRANDIIDVIRGYVPLQKRGSQYWVNCPFHDEKTPSFTVSPSRQTYKCFGCGVYGNVIDFVMAHEKLDFREALEKLADRGGVTLSYEGGNAPGRNESSLRARALEMMEWAQRGFVANLAKHEPARQYLESRGLGGEVAESWGIGYAPDEFHRQSDAALRKFDVETIEATGLCKRNERGWYDFFRGRVTFPIRDARGRIVGFGARLLDPDAKAQKYVNSAEGLLFHKSRLLYGVDRLAQSRKLKETGRVLLMEGYTDVIAAHEAGFDNTVAPLGTALTREQVSLAHRYGDGITLVLDGDEAGQAAAERGVNVVLEMGVDAKVATITSAKDPFDLLRQQGPQGLQRVLDDARDAFDFKLELIRRRHDLQRPVEAEQALRELATMIGRAESPSLRELYARRAATALNLREAAVMSAVQSEHIKHAETQGREQQPRQAQPPAPGGARAAYEREVLRRLFEHPRTLATASASLTPEAFSTEALRELYREMLNAWDEHGEVVPGALLSHLQNEARQELERVLEHIRIPADLGSPVDEEEERRLVQEIQKLAAGSEKPRAQGLEELRQKKGRRTRQA
ncbi:MAG: DNA primase [Planctomycetes bacterium]|nr:DNA primase [Planctomycetota bacterium]MCB9934951.1 DNA primase [Planctomycetota bacterium]